jgi:ferric-dicitrate binding protein FerR (iron transport regulator)
MEITTASVAACVPIVRLLGSIIQYLIELEKHSKKHAQVLADLKAALGELREKMEHEIELRKKAEERMTAERAFTRRWIYGAAGLAASAWIYIGMHLAGMVR